jgi:pimeloyl-ACP methyl ester carboxylesterase
VRAFADALAAIAHDDFPTAMPLAPVIRSPAPFEWCTKARRTQALGYDIQRADYRLSDLGLPEAELQAIRAISGFEDLGFAIFGGARLGPIDDPGAFARATEVVVLMHGLYGTRETWRFVSATCCRANGQAIVIAPDLFGFGESRFAGGAPEPEHVRPEALPRTMLALQSLLGLAGLPTIWVAHSAAATSILAVDDAEIPLHVHRVAITPYYPSSNPIARGAVQLMLLLMRALCWLEPAHRWMARVWAYNAKTAVYSSEERERMRETFGTATAAHNHRLLATYGRTRPRGGSTLARTMIILVEDDPLSPAAVLTRLLRREGFPEDKIFRLARGSHLPHSLEDFAARNINDIAAVIDTVLDSTRGETASTHVEARRTMTWVS